MSIDREQIRRDAEESIATRDRKADRLARHCLALLAELEQAEEERDERTPHWGVDRDAYEQVKRERDEALDGMARAVARSEMSRSRLAKVPALVEALKLIASGQLVTEAISEPMPDMIDGSKTLVTYHHSKEPAQIARDALATWEQA